MSVFGFCDNKCKHEVYTKDETYSKEEVYTKEEVNTYRGGTKLSSTDDVNRIYEPGTYLCTYDNLPANLPVNKTGVLEVIKSGNIVDHCIQIYHVEDYNEVYTRHISEELNNWVKVVTSGDYATLTGTMTLTANTQENLENNMEQQTILKIDFPEGFNKDNCICLAFGFKTVENKNYSYGIGGTSSNRMVAGSFFRHAVLGASDDDSKIALQVWQPATEAKTGWYKLVLMKI